MRHGFVVPAHGHKPVEALDTGQPVAVERRIRVLMPYPHARAHRSNAGADIGSAVHIHQAVGTFAGEAEQAARPMVLEAASEDAAACSIKRRRHGVAGPGFHGLAIKFERKSLGAVGHYSGKNASRTSLVVVFLSACSHSRQPERWNHHSFCTADSFVFVYVYSIQSSAGASGCGRCFTSPPKRNS